MRRLALIGVLAAMMSKTPSGKIQLQERSKPRRLKSKNKPSKAYWRTSPPSEYFGKRSMIVTAETPKGEKQMKLKNALKKNFEFQF